MSGDVWEKFSFLKSNRKVVYNTPVASKVAKTMIFSENPKKCCSAKGMPRRFGGLPIRESNVFVLYNKCIDRSDTVRNLMFLNIELS